MLTTDCDIPPEEEDLHIEIESQDYVYVKWEYWSTIWKIKHHLRHENKVDENKVLSYIEAFRYMWNNKKKLFLIAGF